MVNNLLLLFFLILAFVGPAHSQNRYSFDTDDLNPKTRQAYFRLLKAEKFSIGHTGYTGERSGEESALRILIKSSKSVKALVSLVQSASPEGKLYGLFGLILKGESEYQKGLRNLNSKYEPPERISFWGIRETDNTGAVVVKNLDYGIIPTGTVVIDIRSVIQIKRWPEVISAIENRTFDKLFNRR